MQDAVDLFVCITCKREDGVRPGGRLIEALDGHPRARVQGVECLAVCKRPCTVAVSSPGKWSYIIGDLNPETDLEALRQYLDSYAASEHGTPPLKERPAAIRAGTVARIPPQA